MSRSFLAAFAGGLALVALLVSLLPVPEHYRYRSLIEVQPNGGRLESFVIRWPQDRLELPGDVLISDRITRAAAMGMMVAESGNGERVSAELFRLRDGDGNIIGVASRLAAARPGAAASSSDWLLVVPSRGSLALSQTDTRDVTVRQLSDEASTFASALADNPAFWRSGQRYQISGGPGPQRSGEIIYGTGEFAGLRGRHSESWELDEVLADGTTRGRIVLETISQRESP